MNKPESVDRSGASDGSTAVDRRCDHWAEAVGKAIQGDADDLTTELDAMHGFLREWSKNYGDEDEPRLAMITGMIADLCCIVAMQCQLRELGVGEDKP